MIGRRGTKARMRTALSPQGLVCSVLPLLLLCDGNGADPGKGVSNVASSADLDALREGWATAKVAGQTKDRQAASGHHAASGGGVCTTMCACVCLRECGCKRNC